MGDRRGYAGEDQQQDDRSREYKDYYYQQRGYQQGDRESHKHRGEHLEDEHDREADAAMKGLHKFNV